MKRLAEILDQYQRSERALPTYDELRAIIAAPAAPSEQAEPTTSIGDDPHFQQLMEWRWNADTVAQIDRTDRAIIAYIDLRDAAAAAPAAPLPAQPGQIQPQQNDFGQKVTDIIRGIRTTKSLAWRDSLVENLIDLIEPSRQQSGSIRPSAEPAGQQDADLDTADNNDEVFSAKFYRAAPLPELTGPSASLPVVAWLIDSYDRYDKLHQRVELSPLADNMMDESSEAEPLCTVASAQAAIAAALASPSPAPAPTEPFLPARRFINVTGFLDADYVEFAEGSEYGGGVRDGVPHESKHYTRAEAEKIVRNGTWREVGVPTDTSPASSMSGITRKACDFCEGAGGWGVGEDAEGCTKCSGTGKESAETAAPGASTEDVR